MPAIVSSSSGMISTHSTFPFYRMFHRCNCIVVSYLLDSGIPFFTPLRSIILSKQTLNKRFDFLVVPISSNLPQVIMISTGDDKNLSLPGSRIFIKLYTLLKWYKRVKFGMDN